MVRQAAVSSMTADSCLAKLAEFFPDAVPARIPVKVTRISVDGAACTENAVIEYGTPDTVLFASGLPLDFEDRIRMVNSDGSFDTEAEVVAVSLHRGKTAIAARFRAKVANWIIQE